MIPDRPILIRDRCCKSGYQNEVPGMITLPAGPLLSSSLRSSALSRLPVMYAVRS